MHERLSASLGSRSCRRWEPLASVDELLDAAIRVAEGSPNHKLTGVDYGSEVEVMIARLAEPPTTDTVLVDRYPPAGLRSNSLRDESVRAKGCGGRRTAALRDPLFHRYGRLRHGWRTNATRRLNHHRASGNKHGATREPSDGSTALSPTATLASPSSCVDVGSV